MNLLNYCLLLFNVCLLAINMMALCYAKDLICKYRDRLFENWGEFLKRASEEKEG